MPYCFASDWQSSLAQLQWLCPLQVPMPIKERSCHAAVAVDRDLYIFGGDNTGDMLKEYAMCDTNERSAANWLEPILKVRARGRKKRR